MNKALMIIKIFVTVLLGITPLSGQNTVRIGTLLKDIALEALNRETQYIPDFGKKPVIVFYTDPESKDFNDPVSQAIVDNGFGIELAGLGIINCADTWFPDAIIRKGAQIKQKQFKGAVMLLDRDHYIPREWNLGDCNNASVILIVGRDRRLKYFNKVRSEEESRQAIRDVIKVLSREVKGTVSQ
ncbi:MAG: hypothetical protein H6Q23_1706 [Bacteroidetes bacterium]|nr:hypothetical protein [Bacteroidota bacterium]